MIDCAGLVGLSLFSFFRCDNGKLSNSPLGPSDGTSFRLRVAVAPSAVSVVTGGTQTFSASGGTTTTSGVYSWSVSNATLGSIDSSSGLFTAGVTAGSLVVTATDSVGNTGTATATVAIATSTISITPLNLTIVQGGTQTFSATGGTGSYTWSVSDWQMGTIISTTGAFTAGPSNGTVEVSATDQSGAVGYATVTIISSTITITPVDLTIAQGGTQTFSATGGTGSYTWTVSDTSLGRIVSTTGAFTAWYAAGTLTVTATDTAGNTGTTNVTIVPTGLTITPISLILNVADTTTFETTGGTAPYFYSSSDTTVGTIGLHTGAIIAVAAGTTTITVTDSAGNTGTALVTVL